MKKETTSEETAAAKSGATETDKAPMTEEEKKARAEELPKKE